MARRATVHAHGAAALAALTAATAVQRAGAQDRAPPACRRGRGAALETFIRGEGLAPGSERPSSNVAVTASFSEPIDYESMARKPHGPPMREDPRVGHCPIGEGA